MSLTSEHRNRILSFLHERVKPEIYQTWCLSLDFDRREDDSVLVPVPNNFYGEWMDRELRKPIEDAFQHVFGDRPQVRFSVQTDRPQPMPTPLRIPAPPQPKIKAPQSLSFTLRPDYTFDRFIIGQTNRMAHAAAVSVAERLGSFANPLFIHGSSGLGKTHLLQGICHSVLERTPDSKILYLTCENFVSDYVSAVRRKEFDSFRARYRNLDVLLIDDIHFLAGKDSSQEEFFHTFNELYSAGRQVILSADASPKHIPTLEERLTSRFVSGFVARMDPPTYETRLAILHQRAEEKGYSIPDEVLTYIASYVQTNIRELEGAINKILASAALTHRRIDIDLAREALQGIETHPERTLTPEEIIQAVARQFGKKISDFKTRRWTKSTSQARHVAIYLTKHLTKLSLVEIGKAFGGKDHSTILYAVRKIENQVQADEEFKEELERLGKSLYRPL